MSYVDGYLLPVPADKLDEYKKIASRAWEICKELGALAYKECVIDDDNIEGMLSFSHVIDAKPGEKAIFAFVVFESRAKRDEVNAKVHNDPRLQSEFKMEDMPFDCKRMAFGGFIPLVDL